MKKNVNFAVPKAQSEMPKSKVVALKALYRAIELNNNSTQMVWDYISALENKSEDVELVRQRLINYYKNSILEIESNQVSIGVGPILASLKEALRHFE